MLTEKDAKTSELHLKPFFASRPLEVLPGKDERRSTRGYTLTLTTLRSRNSDKLTTLATALSELRLNSSMS